MKTYLLSIVQPDGPPPPTLDLDRIMQDVGAVIGEIRAANCWVFNGGLHPASAATVVKVQDGEVLLTDGPYAEGREHVGGFVVLKAPDLDVALGWAQKLARAITLPIEVRPFAHTGER